MARKSAKKSAKPRGPGRPFQKGGDPRSGRGPAPGAPKAGRPPDEFKAMLAGLASWDATIASLERILSDPDHPAFQKALDYVTDRGYQKLGDTLAITGADGGPLAVTITRRIVDPAAPADGDGG